MLVLAAGRWRRRPVLLPDVLGVLLLQPSVRCTLDPTRRAADATCPGAAAAGVLTLLAGVLTLMLLPALSALSPSRRLSGLRVRAELDAAG